LGGRGDLWRSGVHPVEHEGKEMDSSRPLPRCCEKPRKGNGRWRPNGEGDTSPLQKGLPRGDAGLKKIISEKRWPGGQGFNSRAKARTPPFQRAGGSEELEQPGDAQLASR